MKKASLLPRLELPKPIEITNDMLPSLKEEAEKHNARLKKLEIIQKMSGKEQVKMALSWGRDGWEEGDE